MARFASGHALVVGVGGDLPVTVADADAIAEVLTTPERGAYPLNQVRWLTQQNASRDKICASLEQIAAKVAPDDVLTIFYSGHGMKIGDVGKERYFLLTNGTDVTRIEETALDGQLFTELIMNVPVRRRLILLDCCHAGGVISQHKGAKSSGETAPVDVTRLTSQGNGNLILSSSQEDEVSLGGRPYSAFTKALIEGLSGGAAKSGLVRVGALAMYVYERVMTLTNGSQRPNLDFESDNFVVARCENPTIRFGGPSVEDAEQMSPRPTSPINEVISHIRELVSAIHGESRVARTFAQDLGVDDGTIPFEHPPLVFWQDLLNKLHAKRLMGKFFDRMDSSFLENEDWHRIKDEYRISLERSRGKSEIAGDRTRGGQGRVRNQGAGKILPFPLQESQQRAPEDHDPGRSNAVVPSYEPALLAWRELYRELHSFTIDSSEWSALVFDVVEIRTMLDGLQTAVSPDIPNQVIGVAFDLREILETIANDPSSQVDFIQSCEQIEQLRSWLVDLLSPLFE